jgi:hypothetical protein
MPAIAKHIDRPECPQFYRDHDLIRQWRRFKQSEIRPVVPIPGKEERLSRAA